MYTHEKYKSMLSVSSETFGAVNKTYVVETVSRLLANNWVSYSLAANKQAAITKTETDNRTETVVLEKPKPKSEPTG